MPTEPDPAELPAFDPDPPEAICPRAGLAIYDYRAVLAEKLRDAVIAGVPGAEGLTIRVCAACGGLHPAALPLQVPPREPATQAPARCRKRRYRTKTDALIAQKYMRATDDRDHRREKRAYRCPQCGGAWHLTST